MSTSERTSSLAASYQSLAHLVEDEWDKRVPYLASLMTREMSSRPEDEQADWHRRLRTLMAGEAARGRDERTAAKFGKMCDAAKTEVETQSYLSRLPSREGTAKTVRTLADTARLTSGKDTAKTAKTMAGPERTSTRWSTAAVVTAVVGELALGTALGVALDMAWRYWLTRDAGDDEHWDETE